MCLVHIAVRTGVEMPTRHTPEHHRLDVSAGCELGAGLQQLTAGPVSSVWDSGEWWMLLAAQSMAVRSRSLCQTDVNIPAEVRLPLWNHGLMPVHTKASRRGRCSKLVVGLPT